MCIRDRYHIPLDEYPRRCVNQIEEWKKTKASLTENPHLEHTRTHEYGSYIMEAMVENKPYKIGGNVINTGLITNLPAKACVEAVSYTHLDVYKRQAPPRPLMRMYML